MQNYFETWFNWLSQKYNWLGKNGAPLTCDGRFLITTTLLSFFTILAAVLFGSFIFFDGSRQLAIISGLIFSCMFMASISDILLMDFKGVPSKIFRKQHFYIGAITFMGFHLLVAVLYQKLNELYFFSHSILGTGIPLTFILIALFSFIRYFIKKKEKPKKVLFIICIVYLGIIAYSTSFVMSFSISTLLYLPGWHKLLALSGLFALMFIFSDLIIGFQKFILKSDKANTSQGYKATTSVDEMSRSEKLDYHLQIVKWNLYAPGVWGMLFISLVASIFVL